MWTNKLTKDIYVGQSKDLLNILTRVYGGKIYLSNYENKAFKWIISRKREVLNLIDNYFHWNNCISAKHKKFGMIKEFYHLSSIGALKAPIDSPLGKSFKNFMDRSSI